MNKDMNKGSDTSETVRLTNTGTGFILTLLSLIALMTMYTETMIIAALPRIQSQFNTTTAWIAWVVSIYLISSSVAIPILSKLGDSHGKKKFLLVGMIFYTIGVICNGFAWNLPSLLVFRAIQGVGLGVFPLAFAIIRDEFPPERVPTATGIISAMFGAGAAIGLVVGSWIANAFGWQATYHTVIPVAVVLTLLAAYKLKESPIRTPSRVDVFGATTFAVAVISFLVAMTEGQTWGWTSVRIIGLLGVALAFVIIFLVIESRIHDPLIDLAVLRKRNVFLANITSFIAGLVIFMVFQAIVYLMQLPPPFGFGTDIFQAGAVLAPGAILMLFTAPIAGAVVARRGPKLPLFVGAAIGAAGLYYFYVCRATQLQIALGAVIALIGVGFMFTAMINVVIQSVAQSQTGIATGTNAFFRTIGSAVGPPITGVYLAQYVSPLIIQTRRGPVTGPLLPNTMAFDHIFLTGFGFVVITMLVTLLIKGKVKAERVDGGETPVDMT